MKKFDINLCCKQCKSRVEAQKKALLPLQIKKWVAFGFFVLFLLPAIRYLIDRNFPSGWWINWGIAAVGLFFFFVNQKKIKKLFPDVYGIYYCETCNTFWNFEPPVNTPKEK